MLKRAVSPKKKAPVPKKKAPVPKRAVSPKKKAPVPKRAVSPKKVSNKKSGGGFFSPRKSVSKKEEVVSTLTHTVDVSIIDLEDFKKRNSYMSGIRPQEMKRDANGNLRFVSKIRTDAEKKLNVSTLEYFNSSSKYVNIVQIMVRGYKRDHILELLEKSGKLLDLLKLKYPTNSAVFDNYKQHYIATRDLAYNNNDIEVYKVAGDILIQKYIEDLKYVIAEYEKSLGFSSWFRKQ